jgi:hypothetical protein
MGLNHADGVTECGRVDDVACVAYNCAPPRLSSNFLFRFLKR